ncbi:MAG: SDR family oxidoreductase [Anaerolineaceae bacterium]|nr:SDR family oxidoreductase [Anaerolineaceae bacterium]MBN2678300.1 SDR family oxidoreductase [Anaerolineaceae bacterium]
MILVTGATGHIGNVLIRKLLKRKEHVRAMVLPNEDRTALEGLNIEIVEGDVLDLKSLRQAMQGVDRVFHLAGLISVLPGEDPIVRMVNLTGTRNVAEVAREMHVRRLIYTSSIHAIQRIEKGTIDETVPFDPKTTISSYDRSKAEASLAVLDAVRDGLDAVIVCPTGVIGPHDYRGSEMGRLFMDWMKSRFNFLVKGAYDFVDVRDVADGQILASERGRKGESYILSGQKISLPEILRQIQKALGVTKYALALPIRLAMFAASFAPLYMRIFGKKPRFTTYSLETVMGNSTISNAKARRELGFRPRPMVQSIRETVKWLLQYQKVLKTAKNV